MAQSKAQADLAAFFKSPNLINYSTERLRAMKDAAEGDWQGYFARAINDREVKENALKPASERKLVIADGSVPGMGLVQAKGEGVNVRMKSPTLSKGTLLNFARKLTEFATEVYQDPNGEGELDTPPVAEKDAPKPRTARKPRKVKESAGDLLATNGARELTTA